MTGRYVLGQRLAVGGMAEIFAARVKGAGGFEKDVVVKRVLPAFAGDAMFRERFFQEARLAALLSHPNIVQTYELIEQDGDTLLAMEAVHGADIATLLRTVRDVGKPLPVSCALHVAACIADALAYAHDKKGADGKPLGLVHRDVTPSNILVSADGVPKLIDFGIAKAASGSAPQTQAGLVLGKAWYLSPEQCLGRPVDGKSDVFGLGVVLFQMLAGRVPFGGRNGVTAMDKITRGLRPSLASLITVPQVVEQVVDAALIVDRELRPSAKVWRAQIERALSAVDPERKARDELIEIVQSARARPSTPAPIDGIVSASAPTLLLMDLSAASAEAGAQDDDDQAGPSSPETGDTGEVARGVMVDLQPAATLVDARPRVSAPTSARGLVAAGFVAVLGAIGAVALVVWLRSDDDADATSANANADASAKDAPHLGAAASELRRREAPVDEPSDVDDADDEEEEDDDVVEAGDGGPSAIATKPRKNKRKRVRSARTTQVEKTESVNKGVEQPAKVAKVEGKGVILFHSEPWAQVWLGGKSLGMTWTGPLDVPAGKHTLYLKNPVSGHEKTVVVDVKAGTRQSLYVTMEKREPPKKK